MKINPLSGRALYKQVADDLRARIEDEDGDLSPGDELPSEADLEDEYEIGVGTIRRALQLLIREGLIRTERGQRHQVAERPEPEIVIVRPGARTYARIARPADSRAHGVPEGAYLIVVVEKGREKAYLADRTVVEFRK